MKIKYYLGGFILLISLAYSSSIFIYVYVYLCTILKTVKKYAEARNLEWVIFIDEEEILPQLRKEREE